MILYKSNILSFNFLNNLSIIMFLMLRKTKSSFWNVFLITINLFDYN